MSPLSANVARVEPCEDRPYGQVGARAETEDTL